MNIEQRNTIFADYMNIIRYTVNRHRSMMKVLRMDGDDLAQELAIYLLKAIERYDADRGAKQSTYYFNSLRYGVLQLWREQTRKIRLANLQAVSLTRSDEYGEESTLDVPFTVDYDDSLMVQEFLQTLSACERDTLARKMHGHEPDDKRLNRFMKIIKRKAMRFCAAGGLA
jgi:DNA-directed RNA polymerase specialized sigma24 family protein